MSTFSLKCICLFRKLTFFTLYVLNKVKEFLREILDKHALSQQSSQLSSAQFRDDNRFYKDRLPLNNAPDWACKPNDSTQETAPNRLQTPSARPVRTESMTLNRPINPPVRSASTGSARTERTTLNVRPINPPVRPAPVQTAPVRTSAPVRNVQYRPTRDYDDWINYNAEYEYQYGNRQLLE